MYESLLQSLICESRPGLASNGMKTTQYIDIPRQTKIVATLGPATTEQKVLESLIDAGLSVARMNMSHGDHKEHALRVKNLRKAAEVKRAHVGVLVDLAGPKIRTGELSTETVDLVPGKKLILTTEKVIGTAAKMSVNYTRLPREVKAGGFIMLDDGRRKLFIEKIVGNEIHTKILIGGSIKPRRGVNVPGAYLSLSAITAKDKKDIVFAIEQKAEYVALSFVRTVKDVTDARKLLSGAKDQPLIIAKIETPEAVDNIDAILAECDGIMIARGDLAIEVPREMVPVIQKTLIRRARAQRKLVITATQMLETMIKNPVPTRAEVSDIANAIFDGTDAVMLSEESAMGEYAKEAVAMMRSVALATDKEISIWTPGIDIEEPIDAIKKESCTIAELVGAKAIIALTETGNAPQKIAAFKTKFPIIALTDKPFIARRLSLVRGVWPILYKSVKNIPELQTSVKEIVTEYKIAKKGDRVVVVSGMMFGKPSNSNMLFVETI